MKSISDILRILRATRGAENRRKNSLSNRTQKLVSVEAVEDRVLLSAQTKVEVFQQQPYLDAATTVDSYFVLYDSPQNLVTLQTTVDADSVTVSSFVSDGCEFNSDCDCQPSVTGNDC